MIEIIIIPMIIILINTNNDNYNLTINDNNEGQWIIINQPRLSFLFNTVFLANYWYHFSASFSSDLQFDFRKQDI